MLQPQAMQRGRWRKAIAYSLLERRNLSGAALLHATSEQEADAIRDLQLGVLSRWCRTASTSPRRSRPPAAIARGSASRRTPSSCCSSDACIASSGSTCLPARLPTLRATHPSAHLVLAGPDEHGLRAGSAATAVPARRRCARAGVVSGAEKWALLKDADVMVQCSDSESFGLAVVESLAAGVPVIATRTTPWREIEARDCGFWVEQTAPAIAAALRMLVDVRRGAPRMGERAAVFAREQSAGMPSLRRWPASTRTRCNVSAPVIVLTPNFAGRDGISRLARLVAGTFDDATVLALHEPSATATVGRDRARHRRPAVAFRGRCAWVAASCDPRHDGDRGAPARGACRARIHRARRLARGVSLRHRGLEAADLDSARRARSRRPARGHLAVHARRLPRSNPRFTRPRHRRLPSRRGNCRRHAPRRRRRASVGAHRRAHGRRRAVQGPRPAHRPLAEVVGGGARRASSIVGDGDDRARLEQQGGRARSRPTGSVPRPRGRSGAAARVCELRARS